MTYRTLIVATALSAAAILPASASAADSKLLVSVADHMTATAHLSYCSTHASCASAGMRAMDDLNDLATRLSARLSQRSSAKCKAAAPKLVAAGTREIAAAKRWIAHPTNGTLGAFYVAARATDRVTPGVLAC